MRKTVATHLVFTMQISDVGTVRRGDVSDVQIIPGEEMICTQEEMEKAAEQIKEYFSGQFEFKDCKLNFLQYEEKLSNERTKNYGRKTIVFRGYFDIGEDPAFWYRGNKFGACSWEVSYDEKQQNWEAKRLQNL